MQIGFAAEDRRTHAAAGFCGRRGITGGYWLNRTGLYELNGTPKPAWSSFVGFTGGQP